MLKELKFVMGSVSKKDFVPAMTHFRIENGHVRGFNGHIAISSPIALDINCNPKAADMFKAIQTCKDTVKLSLTPTGRLRIASGKFTRMVQCITGETPHPMPQGVHVNFDGERLLKAFRILEDFIGDDASRPWSNGVLLRGHSAYATNNTCLVEYWIGSPFPHVVNIPRSCVVEINRINEPPTHAQFDESSITFHYTDGRWIRSQLLQTEWPFEVIGKILETPSSPQPIPDDLFEGLEMVSKMTDGTNRVYIKDGAIRTHLDLEAEEGATYELPGLDIEGCYNVSMLLLLKDVVTSCDFSLYPKPCIFYGDSLRGAIVGNRM